VKYFETHAHYDDKRYKDDRDEVIKAAYASGVEFILNSGASYSSSVMAVELSKKYDFVYAGVGVHPHYADSLTDEILEKMIQLCSNKKVVAFGEIGLDFFRNLSPKSVQIHWFERQLWAAKAVKLPVIIHSRDSDQAVFDTLKKANMPDYGNGKGVVHCYSGSTEMALEYVKMGYFIGIGGVITFSNARKLVEAVEKIPLEKLLIETDCPYLSPEPNRGERNDSSNLKFIVEKIAQIKKVTPKEVAKITLENAVNLFNIK